MICVPVFIMVFLIRIPSPAQGSGDASEKEAYINELIKKADEKRLWEDPEWEVLLHYKKGFFGTESLVDDPAFFISEHGKTDPREEMHAAIRALFLAGTAGKPGPMCRFTARGEFLIGELSVDRELLPAETDESFNRYYNEIKPSRIVLVFPAGYMNSPASMYGHTFLLIDSEESGRLQSKTANYAAITDDTFGPVFAFKGLFGFYLGYFSFLPYYKKIQDYSDSEMRDMWEYELDLTPSEIKKVLRHVMEMEKIWSEYYFLDENCSFNLLYLVEAARPGTKLTDSFTIGVEPVDTIRVIKENNLVLRRVYRPSLYTKINYLRSKLSGEEEEFVLSVCGGEADIAEITKLNITDEKKTVICDLCVDYLKFMALKGKAGEEDYKQRFMAILEYRSTLPQADNYKDLPEPAPPEESHGSRRIAFLSGYSDGGWFSGISYRQTCHELMDPDEGYNSGSQIVFGSIEARFWYETKKFTLERFDVINLLSLPDSDSFFFSPCYGLRTGLVRNSWNGRYVQSYNIRGMTGLAARPVSWVQIYLLAGADTYFAGVYDNNTDLLPGCEGGMITAAGPWKNHMYAGAFRAFTGMEHTLFTATASERVTINRSCAIMVEIKWANDSGQSSINTSLSACFYF